MATNLHSRKRHPWRWIALMAGMLIGLSGVKAQICDLSIQQTQIASNVYNFEAISNFCSVDSFSSLEWDIYDDYENLVYSSSATSFSYTFNLSGYYYIYLYANDTAGNSISTYSYVNISSTCPATGTLDTVETQYNTGYAKFRITPLSADKVRLVFDDYDPAEGDTLLSVSGTVDIAHTYSLNNPSGTNYRYPYAYFINTAENCSTAVYMPDYGNLKFLNKNCAVDAYAYAAYDSNYNYIPYTISFYASTYNSDESNISVNLYYKGSLLDSFELNTTNYSFSKNYTFSKAGLDTLIVVSKGQYCSTTDTIEFYVYGKPCPTNLSLDYAKTDSAKNTYQFTLKGIKDTGFTYYWEISGGSIYTDTTTTDSTLTVDLPTDDYISIWVNAYKASDDCNTGWYYTNVTTGSLNCYASFYYYYDTIPKTISLYNYSEEGKTYLWDFGDGDTSTVYNPGSHTYAKEGIYTIKLTVYDATNNCVQSYEQRVTIGNVGCKADFTASVNGQTVIFTNLSTGAQNTYWDFGDYGYSEENSPTHTYASDGIYTVYLWIYNSSQDTSCWDEITKTVVVGDINNMLASGFDYYSEDNSTFIFSDASKGKPTKWYWTFGDGTYSSETNPQKTYNKAGQYSVCLTVTNAAGASSSSCQTIWVGNSNCSAEASFTSRISGKNVSFTNRSSGDYDKVYWDFGDGTASNEVSPAHAYAADGYYAVTLTVRKSGSDCADSYTEYIQIGSVDCKADFAYSVDAASRTVNLSFSGKAGNNPYFYWIFDDGDYAETSTVTKTFDNAGKHEVWLVVYDLNTLCMDYTSKEIQVGEMECSANFAYYVDSSTNKAWCINQSVGDSLLYLWEFGDGTYSTDVNPSHTFKQPGYYTIGLTAYNPNTWCLDYFETIVLITGRGIDCQADFAYIADHTNKKVSFSDKSKGNIVDYIWDFGDGTISNQANPEKTYNRSGAYNVCLTVWNDDNIPNMTCKRIKVGISDEIRCEANFGFMIDAGNKKVMVVDKSVGNPNQYFWSFGDGGTATTANSEHVYNDNGYYLISLDIATPSGCESYTYKVVNVGMPDTLLYMFDYRTNNFSKKAGGYPVDFIGAGLGEAARLKWDFGDGSTSTTSSTPTHVYNQPGTYTVCVTATDPVTGDSSTYCQQITVTGIRDVASQSAFSMYPNPANDRLTLSFHTPNNGMVNIEIIDLSGRLVARYDQYLNKGNHNIPLNIKSLPAGSFIVKINSSQNEIGKGMLIKK